MLLLLIVAELTSCSFVDKVQPTPLGAAQSVIEAAVYIEDLNEDPDQDEQQASVIELVADLLRFPMNVVRTFLPSVGALVWSAGDFLVGNEVNVGLRDKQLTPFLGPQWASATPRGITTIDCHNPRNEGCTPSGGGHFERVKREASGR